MLAEDWKLFMLNLTDYGNSGRDVGKTTASSAGVTEKSVRRGITALCWWTDLPQISAAKWPTHGTNFKDGSCFKDIYWQPYIHVTITVLESQQTIFCILWWWWFDLQYDQKSHTTKNMKRFTVLKKRARRLIFVMSQKSRVIQEVSIVVQEVKPALFMYAWFNVYRSSPYQLTLQAAPWDRTTTHFSSQKKTRLKWLDSRSFSFMKALNLKGNSDQIIWGMSLSFGWFLNWTTQK